VSSTSTMKAAEQALRAYGASDLVKEYDESMSAATREKLLEALLNTVRQRLIHFITTQTMNALRSGSSVPPKGPPLKDKKCPLVRALVGYGVQRSSLSQDAIEFCRAYLQQDQWGSGVGFTPCQKILRYNRSVAQQKTNPQYNSAKNSTSKHNFSMSTNGSIVKTGGTTACTAGGTGFVAKNCLSGIETI
jgi:hypothetical protein